MLPTEFSPLNKGKRFIITHAITEHGPLAVRPEGEDYAFPPDGAIMEPFKFNAESLFESKESGGDYHKALDSEWYKKWMENRYIPTFKEAFPGKRAIYIGDNAGYHCLRSSTYVNPKTMYKKDCVLWLKKHGVTGAVRDGLVTWGGTSPLEWNVKGLNGLKDDKKNPRPDRSHMVWTTHESLSENAPRGPYPEELQAHIATIVKDHKSHLNKTGLEEILEKEDQWLVLFTPPNASVFQPIELFWAFTKNSGKTKWRRNRTMKQLKQHIRMGMYGDDLRSGNCNCERLIRHAEKEMLKSIGKDTETYAAGSTLEHILFNETKGLHQLPDVAAYIKAVDDPTLENILAALELLKPDPEVRGRDDGGEVDDFDAFGEEIDDPQYDSDDPDSF